MSDKVLMPQALTAENGAKAAFSGEFYWEEEVPAPCQCEENYIMCDACYYDEYETIKHVVPWYVIKQIYAAAVEKYAVQTV